MAKVTAVRFLNVGQGDSAIVSLDTGWSALLDGGRSGAVKPFSEYVLRSFAPIDLIVGTHFDADHLDGLTTLVRAGLGVRGAVLPPQVHPEGTAVSVSSWASDFGWASPLLADHFAAGRTVGDVYRALDERATGPLATVDRLWGLEGSSRPTLSARAVAIRDELEAGSKVAEVEGLANLAAVMNAARTASVSRHWREETVRPVIRGSRAVARELISASSLKKLVDALKDKEIAWVAPVASNNLRPLVGTTAKTGGVVVAHLGPTERFVRHYAEKVEDVWNRVLMFMALEVDSMPSLSNQLSHVIVFRDADNAVAICGDAGFQGSERIPDSLADGWKDEFARVNLLHLPHHGGSWGRFRERVVPELGRNREDRLTLYGSVGFNKANPPGPGVIRFLDDVAGIRGCELYLANMPAGQVGAYSQRRGAPTAKGPGILELTARGTWRARALDAGGRQSRDLPIHVRVS